jgi:gliding motility-associated-like protein
MRIYLTIVLLMFIYTSFGQKQSNIWYFGKNAGLDFNHGSPIVLEDGNMDNFEGVSCISDRYGKLLFYTDGLTVYDKQHQIMQNGSDLAGHPSSTQSGVIVPVPNSETKYIIFTVDYAYSSGALSYSMVDMSLNSGLGRVTNKNILLQYNSAEKISAVIHANYTDVWVIIHERQSNTFKSYKVTENGIDKNVITSHAGNNIGDGVQGYLKCSSDGQYLAMATYHSRRVDIFNFNQLTGEVTFHSQHSFPDATYGVEFSSDSRFLYATVSYDLKQIYQIDIENGDKMIIATPSMAPGAIQMGPDGKIYVARYDRPNISSKYLGIIHNPDTYGTGCNYEDQALYLGQGASLMGLPTFIQSYFSQNMSISAFNNCFGENTQIFVNLSDDILNYMDWILWDFGDPQSNNNSSSDISPFHIFSDTGLYNIKVTVSVNGEQIFREQEIKVNENPTITLPDTIYLCNNNAAVIVAGDDNFTYEWSNEQTTSSIQVTEPGTLWLRKISFAGCVATDTLEVAREQSPIIDLPNEFTICPDSSILVSAGDSNYSYIWSTGDTLPSIKLDHPGNYAITKIAKSSCRATHNFRINEHLLPDFSLGNDTMLCEGPITFQLDGFYDYNWNNVSTSNTFTINEPMIVKVTAKTIDNCSVSDEVEVFECCKFQIKYPNAFTPNGDGFNETFKPIIIGISKYKMTISNRWGEILFTSTDPEDAWDGKYNNEECPVGVYFVVFDYERCNSKRGFYTETSVGSVTLLR